MCICEGFVNVSKRFDIWCVVISIKNHLRLWILYHPHSLSYIFLPMRILCDNSCLLINNNNKVEPNSPFSFCCFRCRLSCNLFSLIFYLRFICWEFVCFFIRFVFRVHIQCLRCARCICPFFSAPLVVCATSKKKQASDRITHMDHTIQWCAQRYPFAFIPVVLYRSKMLILNLDIRQTKQMNLARSAPLYSTPLGCNIWQHIIIVLLI